MPSYFSPPAIVYLLCAITSLACTVLLALGYRRSRVRLLLWSALCFLGLTVDNVLLFVDRVMLPDFDLSVVRRVPALVAMMLVLYGLVFDAE